MKGILKKTAGTGSWYWTITFPDGKDFESDDGSIFLRDCANLSTGASSLLVCKEDSDKLTNKDYDSVVEFEIVEGFFHDTNTKFREAKIK
jgi:hypothetical protein